MISFMISVVPPKFDWMQLRRLSPTLVPESLEPVLPPAKAGLHLVVGVVRASPVAPSLECWSCCCPVLRNRSQWMHFRRPTGRVACRPRA
jgi:hypothetical protein